MDCRPNSGRLRHWSFPSKNAFHSGNKCRPETQQHPLATSSQAQRDKPTKTKSIILEPGATAPGSCRNSQTLDPTLDQKNLALDLTRQLWTPQVQTPTNYDKVPKRPEPGAELQRGRTRFTGKKLYTPTDAILHKHLCLKLFYIYIFCDNGKWYRTLRIFH